MALTVWSWLCCLATIKLTLLLTLFNFLTLYEGGSYDNTLKPRLEMSTLSITGIDDRFKANVTLLIDTPLSIMFKSNRLTYRVLFADTPVSTDTY